MKYNLSKQTEYILGLVCEAKELATDFKEQVINSSNVSYELIKPFFNPFMEHHEEFWIILMNKANKPVAFVKVSQGGIDGTVVDNKLIFQQAVLANASGVILVHNHPSGTLRPSEGDIRVTKRFIEAAKIMEINVFDHLIVSYNGYYSFQDEGIL